MEYNNEKSLKKRNYSNSPFSNNYNLNDNKIGYFQESFSTQNIDSSISQDEFNYNETNHDFQKILYEKNSIIKKLKNKINDLMIRANDDNNKNIRAQKANEILKNQINILKEELQRNNLNIQNNQNGRISMHKNNYYDLDENLNNFYRNKFDNNYRNSSTKIKKINNNIMNNYDNFEENEDNNKNIRSQKAKKIK